VLSASIEIYVGPAPTVKGSSLLSIFVELTALPSPLSWFQYGLAPAGTVGV